MMNVPSRVSRQWNFSVVPSGTLVMVPFFSAWVNASDSTSLSRTHRPMITITAENRNGTRQPQDMNASEPWPRTPLMMRKIPLAMMKPSGAPSCGNVPYQARFPAGAFSVATRAAPDHSPPSAKPCASRSTSSMRAAHQPICWNVGRHPMRKVAMPIVSSEARGGVVAGREEQDREDEDGRGRVGVEVVELDRRSDEARGDDARARVE